MVRVLRSRLLFASAPLREAVQQPSNAAAAATAPQAIADGLRRAAQDVAAAPNGAPHASPRQSSCAKTPSLRSLAC